MKNEIRYKKWIIALTSIVAVGIIALSTLMLPGVKVKTTAGTLSIGIGKAQSDELSDWTIKFEPSGTHIKNDYLKIRLDFFPAEGSKAYALHYVYVVDESSPEFLAGYKGKLDELGDPVDESEYQAWIDSLPHIWRLNPALCHFIIVPSDITVTELESFIAVKYNADVIATLDDALILPDSIHYISPIMRDKALVSAVKVAPTTDKEILIAEVNTRLLALSITGYGTGIRSPTTPQSIDVGSTSGGASQLASGYTAIEGGNPANATGTIDTVTLGVAAAMNNGCTVATFTSVGENTFTSRDSEAVGNQAVGVQVISGLSIDIETDDYIGLHFATSGQLYRDSSGYAGWRASGDYIPCTDQAFSATAYRLYIYGAGTESGGTPSLANTPASINLGTLWMERTYYAKGTAPSNPVVDDDCTFEITNDGTITCNVTASMTDMTGGTSWNLVSTSPGADEFRMTAYYVGQNPASGLVLTNSAQAFYNGLTASSTIKWDFKYETGTWTDTTAKTGTLTLTAIEP